MCRFLVARAFIPFWYQGERALSEEELDDAEASARRALEIAERLGELRMQNAALDALASVADLRKDAAASREMALRRLAMGKGLDLLERLDAAAMATWMSLDLGEVRDAVRLSGSLLPEVLPGQAVSWTLHLVAWRALSLLLAGMFDEAIAAGDRMRELWAEADRPSAGYALRGFEAAHAAALARKDAGSAERMREVALAIDRAFEREHPPRRAQMALFEARPAAEPLDAAFADIPRLVPATLVRMLTLASDRRIALSAVSEKEPGLIGWLDIVGWDRYPLVLAAAQRAVGLDRIDPALLISARESFERCGAAPSAARARIEAGVVRGERAEVEAGMEALEALGDIDQLERYVRRLGGAS